MEQSKYYTPKIEEFHVGFEFESKVITSQGESWAGIVFSTLDFQRLDSLELTRVKHLDQEDIESLGWVKGSDWVGGKDYYTHSNGKYKLEIVKTKNYNTILIESLSGFKYYNYLESIKNKSELKKLMKQLGINV